MPRGVHLFGLFAGLLWSAGGAAGAIVETRACEMRIEAGWTAAQIRQAVDRVAAAGMNCVQVETFYHGSTIYTSAVMQRYGFPSVRPGLAAGGTALATAIDQGHKNGLKVYAWVETFYVWNTALGTPYAGSIVAKKPDWLVRNASGAPLPTTGGETGHYFLSPANLDARRFLAELYAEIAKTGVDGILVDYLRYPRYSLGPGNALSYDAASKARAQTELGLDITQIPMDVHNADFRRWTLWREQQTTDAARALAAAVRNAAPDMPFIASVHTPYEPDWTTHDSLRDWAAWWPDVKTFSPQYYSGAATARAQIQNDLAHLDPQARLLPNILVSDLRNGSPLLDYVRSTPSLGVCYWVYSSLTNADVAAMASGPFATAAVPAEIDPIANALALLRDALPTLSAEQRPAAQAAISDLSDSPPCIVPAARQLQRLLARTDLPAPARREMDLAYRLLGARTLGDVDADGRVTHADAERTLAAALGLGPPVCIPGAETAPSDDGLLTVHDAVVTLGRSLSP